MTIESMQQHWANDLLTRMAQDGRRVGLILAIDRGTQRVTGYCRGGAAAPEHGIRIQRHSIEDPDGMGAVLASEIWKRWGRVTVSVWTGSHYKERQFTPPQDWGGTHAFPAWMLNMLMLEGRIAESTNDLTALVPSGEGAA